MSQGTKNFSASTLPEQDSNIINDVQPPIKHVEASFARLFTRGEYLAASNGGVIPGSLYTRHKDNVDGFQNHFQGMQRLNQGRYCVISGGDWKTPKSDLFVIKMESRQKPGPWWSNLITSKLPPDDDHIIASIELDRSLWHAGGMDIQGDILVVPIEYSPPKTLPSWPGFKPPDFGKEEASRILFFDFKDPENPKKFPFEIDRKGEKAGAVAMTKLPNGYYLVGVWSDSDKHPDRIDFYLSNKSKLSSGFGNKTWTWLRDEVRTVGEQDRKFSDYQAINFILQEDGQLYLMGLHNTSPIAPAVGFKDYADLYTVDIPLKALKVTPKILSDKKPIITKVGNLCLECKHRHCNLDAGSGVYIDQGMLFIYSVFHYRLGKGIIRFSEFRPPFKGVKDSVTEDNAWLEMYEEIYFQDRRFAILGTKEMTLPNFDKVNAQGTGFEDKASSIRFQLPKGSKCILYEHKDFKKKLPFELKGTGEVVELPDLNGMIGDEVLSMAGKISSIKYVS
jgi:hypothetical protein